MDTDDGNTLMVFGVYDYLTLGFMICISILIGVYSAFIKKDNTVEAYLFGNRKLKIFPVTLSLFASEVTSMSILNLTTEVYLYGSNIFYIIIARIVGCTLIYFVVLPIFHNIRISTVYEYLEMRFSRSVRTMCSFFFTLQIIFTIPILMCITSLSLSLVTGFDFYIVTITTGAITIFYTAIGGIRAVVWADTVQAFFIFLGMIAVAVKGIMDVGSFTAVWNKNVETHRLAAPNFRLDLTEKYSFWEWTVAGGIGWIVYGSLNQGMAQRFLSVPSLSTARKCLLLGGVICTLYSLVTYLIGITLVATFVDCDPLLSNKIQARDQMPPYFIIQTLRKVTGLPGLIIAAVVSMAISTVSTQLNSVAAIVFNDYYKIFVNNNVSENTSNIVLKLSVVILGVIVTLVSFFVKAFGSAFQAYIVFSGAVSGIVLGMFIIGFFLPMIKSKPTLLGSIVGFAVMVWIATGMNLAVVSGRLKAKTKPLYVHGCDRNITIPEPIFNNENVFIFYRISTVWYPLIGMLITVTVSCLLSLFMERNDVGKMDPKLFTPMIHRWLPKRSPNADTEMSLLQDQKKHPHD